MTNIVQIVWKILDNSPCIRRDMSRGLINASALARYIIKKYKIGSSLDAIISAIRRYEIEHQEDFFSSANKLLEQTINISTKSNIAEISLVKDEDVQKTLPKLFHIIQYIQGDVLRVMQANESIRILIDEKNLDKVFDLFPEDKIKTKEKNLAEVNLYIHPEMQNTPGILAIIANELTLNNINIVEVMTCPPEMLFFVRKVDFQKTSNVMHQLCQSNNNNLI